jgi:hypothetical protein
MHEATCTKCGATKPLSTFAVDRSKKRGHKSWCKACDNARGKAYYAANREAKIAKRAGRRQLQPRHCETCGRQYTPHRKDQRHCTTACHNNRTTRIGPSYWALCARCTKTFLRLRRDAARYPDASYCSRSCALRRSSTTALVGPVPRRVVAAGPSCPVVARPQPRLFTARSCRCGGSVTAEGQRVPPTCGCAPKPMLIAGYCRECGEAFVTTGRHQYCCNAHAKRNQRRKDKQQRSKRIKTGAQRERIDLPTLAMRDGWRCHLCKRKVTRRNWSHDHLIPLSAGGSHTYANVALAHVRCNSIRQAGGEVQLRLAA